MTNKNLVIFLYKSGKNQSVIAGVIGISRQRVHQIVSGYTQLGGRARKEIIAEMAIDCFNCGFQREEIHHIDRNSKNNDIKNLMPLCKRCHRAIHRGVPRRRYNPYLKRRPILYCEYKLCKKPFFSVEGRERIQKYHKTSCRVNEFKRRGRLASISQSVTF